MIAYVTAQRTGEFGLRIALGADHGEIRRLVMHDTLRVALAGVLIGVPAALACTRLLASQLYLTAPADPIALSVALIVLIAAACLAGYLPALRAMRVDPAVALRAE
jgi:ABC-type antimicrobial peptide transport system permease subunit